jgi:hypothetical protein
VKRASIILIIFCILSAGLAVADDTVTKFNCGGASITIYNSNVIESPFFVVSISNSIGSFHYSFSVVNEFLDVRYEKSKEGKEYLLINNHCGGSGCSESNFALIDLKTGNMVLQIALHPGGNADKAEDILGKKIEPFSCSKHHKGTCTPNEKGEYCFISPLELG